MLNRMINSKKKIFIYLSITLLPAILISHLVALQQVEEQEIIYSNQAEKYATLHANDLDKLIGETISRLDMVASFTNMNADNLNNVQEILTSIHDKDIRFSGFYWANPKGDIVIGSNDMLSAVNVLDRKYFRDAINERRYMISPAHIGRVTGRFIITIATPVFENEKLNGVLLGSLRIDKVEEYIKQNMNGEVISVSDDVGQTLVKTNKSPLEENSFSETVELSSVPWTVTAHVIPEENHLYERAFLQNGALLLIVTHILFLLIQYYLLKRRVKVEQEQNRRQKLELVENLATSTAHEIRNPLTGIKGLIQLLSEKYKDEKDQLYFKIIQDEVNRINAIVTELLLLGKPIAHKLSMCNANEVIKEIEPIIMSEANYKSIQVSVRYSTYDLPISCVSDHFKQVILNLVKNSLEAVSGDGEVVLSLEKQGHDCVIKVSDNGTGMSKEELNQIFTPFYTMKENGTGLGLVICKRIIESYGGTITIASDQNKGTEAKVCVPLVDTH